MLSSAYLLVCLAMCWNSSSGKNLRKISSVVLDASKYAAVTPALAKNPKRRRKISHCFHTISGAGAVFVRFRTVGGLELSLSLESELAEKLESEDCSSDPLEMSLLHDGRLVDAMI